jgi:hypothetical protein
VLARNLIRQIGPLFGDANGSGTLQVDRRLELSVGVRTAFSDDAVLELAAEFYQGLG